MLQEKDDNIQVLELRLEESQAVLDQKQNDFAQIKTSMDQMRTKLDGDTRLLEDLQNQLQITNSTLADRESEIVQLRGIVDITPDNELELQKLQKELYGAKVELAQLQLDKPVLGRVSESTDESDTSQIQKQLADAYRELDLYRSSASVPTQEYVNVSTQTMTQHASLFLTTDSVWPFTPFITAQFCLLCKMCYF